MLYNKTEQDTIKSALSYYKYHQEHHEMRNSFLKEVQLLSLSLGDGMHGVTNEDDVKKELVASESIILMKKINEKVGTQLQLDEQEVKILKVALDLFKARIEDSREKVINDLLSIEKYKRKETPSLSLVSDNGKIIESEPINIDGEYNLYTPYLKDITTVMRKIELIENTRINGNIQVGNVANVDNVLTLREKFTNKNSDSKNTVEPK